MTFPGNDSLKGAAVDVVDPAGIAARVELAGDRQIIGRSQEASVHIPSTHASRRHAELFCDPFGRWWIRDLGSQNGTLVNGSPVKEQVIGPADEIAIGDFLLKLVLPGASQARTTVRDAKVSVSNMGIGRISTLRDHEAPRIARHHLTKLMELNRRLQNIGDLEKRYDLLCQTLVSPEFQSRWAAVMRVEAGVAEPTPELLCQPQFRDADEQVGPISRGLLRAVLAKGEPVMAAQNAQGAAEVALSMMGAGGGLAAVACPLRQDAVGMELLYIMLPAQYATGEWLALANLGAEEFQHAEMARRAREQSAAHAALERELESARHIQMSLLPKEIALPGLEMGVGFAPCRWVAGDYVDVIRAPDGRLFLAVADVCGKGLPAALLASRVHTGVHSNLAAGMGLLQLMTNLNHYLCKTMPSASFVTMVAMMVDLPSGNIEFVNAGHPPPIVITPGGKESPAQGREFSGGENLPLGLQEEQLLLQQERIAVGDILALYSDGLTELADEAGSMLGIEGLVKELEQLYVHQTVTARTAADGLLGRLATILGEQVPQDDQTFLLIKRV